MECKKGIVLTALMSTALFAQADLLFSDSFDRANSTDINANSAASQSGSVAPLTYGVFATNTVVDTAIVGNRVLVSVDGAGAQRFVPNTNFASAAVAAEGGFEISYTVKTGVDFTGTVQGNHAHNLYLGQKSIVEGNSSVANSFYSLVVTLSGNGLFSVRSQGATLFSNVAATGFNVRGDNDVRLVVDTDSFAAANENSFSLYINEVLMGSTNFAWRAANDLRFGFEAVNYAAEFDNLQIQSIPEPATLGLFILSGVGAILFRRLI
jgi:hypothetical protein